MNDQKIVNKVARSVLGMCLCVVGGYSTAVLSQEADIDQLFQELQARGLTAEEVLIGLIDSGVELKDATGFSVANADSIGLSIAYSQAGICLAPDQAVAAVVGQEAVDSSTDQSRNAVQASVVSTLNAYAEGGCDLLEEQRNNASQAFAAPTGSSSPNATGGGSAPPELELPDPSTSPSE